MTEIIKGDYWRRKSIKHARYVVDSVDNNTVYYKTVDFPRVFSTTVKIWLEIMEPCDADDVMEETGGIF